MRKRLHWIKKGLAALLISIALPALAAVAAHALDGSKATDWRTARRDSTGLSPDPATTPEAVIQVFAARAFRWRGALGVHTWFAVKTTGEDTFTRMEVIGFGVDRGAAAVRLSPGVPDGYWFGNHPWLLRDIRGGAEVDALIDRLRQAAAQYPHNREYRVWPGPNSNTFTAYLARAVPELRLDLPPTAVGKDYLAGSRWAALSPAGRGLQLSAGGVAGVMLGIDEGVELNLLGMTVGVDLWPPALKLPGLGRVGVSELAVSP